MTDNEKLIEVKTALTRAMSRKEWREDGWEVPAIDVQDAFDALAAFEKAHTPTDDEREALTYLITAFRFRERGLRGVALEPDLAVSRPLAEFLHREGFRRSVVPEPSDEHECTWACWVDRYGFDHHPEPRGDLEICQCYRDGSELVTCARHAEPQGETSDAQGIIARALMDSARMDTFNAWSLADEIAAALRAAGVGGAR